MPPLAGALRRLAALLLASATLLTLWAGAATAADEPAGGGSEAPGPVIDILPLEGFLDPPVAGAITDLVRDANERGSTLVVLQLDSPGAVSVDLEELIGTIAGSEVPVAVFVGPFGTRAEVAGGAAVLALAADVLAVAPDASVGPLVPLDLASPSTAPPVVVPDELLDGAAGLELLEELGIEVVDVNGLEPLLTELDGTTVGGTTITTLDGDLTPRLHSLGLLARMLHAAATPEFVYLLLVLGIGMLLFEVFQPGFGVAGLAGLVMTGFGAFGLTVLPVTWWAVALVVLGLVLYALDVAIAGFGPVTLAATGAFAAGSWWFYDHPALQLSGWLVAATTAVAIVFFVFVMTTVLRAQAGPETEAVEQLVGQPGVVRSVLDPEGHVFVDGALWRARWTGTGPKAKVGTPVRVHGIEGAVVLVDGIGRGADDRDGADPLARS